MTFGEVLDSALRHRRAVVLGTLAVSAVALVILLLIPSRFTSSASFVPESSPRTGVAGQGGLASIAAVAGLRLPGSDLTRSPDFYADLLRSRTLVYALLETWVPARRGGPDSVAFLELLHPRGKTQAERLYNGARTVREKLLAVRVERRTSVVEVRFTYSDPVVAGQLTNTLLARLDAFNKTTRQTQARVRRAFVESQVEEADRRLREAEEDLRRFLERNRDYRGSPALQFEQQRLERRVQVNQELFLSLRRDLDVARIDEVDNQPTVSVIEAAIPAARKSWPPRARLTLLATLLALAASSLAAWVADHGRGRFPPMPGGRRG